MVILSIVQLSKERDGLVGIEREQDTTKVVQLSNDANNTRLVGAQVGKDDMFVHDGHGSASRLPITTATKTRIRGLINASAAASTGGNSACSGGRARFGQ
jgi:hypothetical protein